jgi:hypothetical protein
MLDQTGNAALAINNTKPMTLSMLSQRIATHPSTYLMRRR